MGDPLPVHVGSRYLTAVLALLLVATTGVLVLVQHNGGHGRTVQGSGIAAKQERSVPPFHGVELAGSNTITVALGRPQHVVVHADANLLDRVTTTVRHGRLVVGNALGSFSTNTPMRVDITVPSISELTISGSGSVIAEGGTAPSLTATIAGSGEIRASGITAQEVTATISGSGQIVVTALHRLDAAIRGSGNVTYAGHPAQVTTSVSGSGSVIPS